MLIRFAKPEDAGKLLRIYEQYLNTPTTFETELPSKEEFEGRIRDALAVYPYLLYEENGEVLGYAYAHRFRERASYQWTAELSVYLDRDSQSRGIGTKLYTVLIRLLRRQGLHLLLSGVTVPNEKSRRLHLHMGFRLVGVFHQNGYKNGAWHDVEWFELLLSDGNTENNSPIRSIQSFSTEELAPLLLP